MSKKILSGSKRFSFLLILFVFISVLVLPFIKPSKVFADAPPNQPAIHDGVYSWVDRNTIHAKIDGIVYYFRAKTDSGDVFSSDKLIYGVGDSDCDGKIYFDSDFPFDYVGDGAGGLKPHETAPRTIKVDMDFIDTSSTSTNCQGTDPDPLKHIPIGHPGNFNIYFTVASDGRHIYSVGDDENHDHYYTQSGHQGYQNLFTRDSEQGNDCQDVIQVNKANGTYKSYELDKDGSGAKPPDSIHAPSDCKLIGGSGYVQMAVDQKLGNAGALKNDPNPDPGASGGADGSGSLTSCDLNLSSQLSWIICPLIDIGSTTSDFVFSHVAQPLLEDIPISTDRNTGTYKAWQGFRFLANIMLIGSMLAIVYSQAKGGE